MFRFKEAIANKTVEPVVGVANLYFVLALANGGRGNGHLPRRTPCDTAVNAVDEDMRESGRNIAEGEGESLGVWE